MGEAFDINEEVYYREWRKIIIYYSSEDWILCDGCAYEVDEFKGGRLV